MRTESVAVVLFVSCSSARFTLIHLASQALRGRGANQALPDSLDVDWHSASATFQRNMTSLSDLTANQLKRAVEIKGQIEKLERELLSVFYSSASPQSRRSSRMPESTKAKLRAAAKARWAKVNGARKTAPSKKSTMSPAARAKISAAAKARWAKAKAAGKKAL